MKLLSLQIAAIAVFVITAMSTGCAKKQHELKAATPVVMFDSRASGNLEVAQSKGSLGSKPRK